MEKPSKERLYEALDVCDELADYVEEKWSYAYKEISILREAANYLDAHSVEDDEE